MRQRDGGGARIFSSFDRAAPSRIVHAASTTPVKRLTRRSCSKELFGSIQPHHLPSGDDLPTQLKAAAAISVPFDLSRSSRRINRGFSRFYQRFFISSLRRKAQEKAGRFPDLAPADRIAALKTLENFDNLITGPLHGFRDAEDYYRRSSSLPWLEKIRLNTLLLSSVDDPMLPPEVLHEVRDIADENPYLHPEFVAEGGHAGFIAGSVPWRPFYYAEYRVGEFFAEQFEGAAVPRQLAKLRSR